MKQVLISILSLGGIGLLFGVILSILDKKLKTDENPLIKEILDILPGINCGACGFPGCKAFAKEVAKKKELFGGCIPGGEVVNRNIASLVGVEAGVRSTFKVVVLCGAKFGEKNISYDYGGPKTCALANVSLGNIDCRYGCLGFGDCLQVCPTQALGIQDGKVTVDYKKCIGCGKCVEACPRNILKLVEANNTNLYAVSCSNPEDSLSTKKVCSRGCIGCGICTKVIKESPFYLNEGLTKIDYQRLRERNEKELDAAVDKCPVKIISKFHL